MTAWNWKVICIMKNKYIKIYMNSHNEFRTFASISLFGIQFTNVNVKIDTGCGTTTILTSKLGIPKKEAQKLKRQDCHDSSIGKAVSFGVNDTKQFRETARSAFRAKQFEKLDCISFIHEVKNFEVAGTPLGNTEVKVNYDRTGNILIGMDVISTWDTHIGTLNTGKTILLACPKDCLNIEYYDELEKMFKLRPGCLYNSFPDIP